MARDGVDHDDCATVAGANADVAPSRLRGDRVQLASQLLGVPARDLTAFLAGHAGPVLGPLDVGHLTSVAPPTPRAALARVAEVRALLRLMTGGPYCLDATASVDWYHITGRDDRIVGILNRVGDADFFVRAEALVEELVGLVDGLARAALARGRGVLCEPSPVAIAEIEARRCECHARTAQVMAKLAAARADLSATCPTAPQLRAFEAITALLFQVLNWEADAETLYLLQLDAQATAAETIRVLEQRLADVPVGAEEVQ